MRAPRFVAVMRDQDRQLLRQLNDLGVPRGTVKSRLSRALARLRAALDEAQAPHRSLDDV